MLFISIHFCILYEKNPPNETMMHLGKTLFVYKRKFNICDVIYEKDGALWGNKQCQSGSAVCVRL